jgi:hypothetical protein
MLEVYAVPQPEQLQPRIILQQEVLPLIGVYQEARTWSRNFQEDG